MDAVHESIAIALPQRKELHHVGDRDEQDGSGSDGAAAIFTDTSADTAVESGSDSSDKSQSISTASTVTRSKLPPSILPHLRRFVDDTARALDTLTDYLLTEQLSELDDETASMRHHVTQLIQHADHDQLLMLNQLRKESCTQPRGTIGLKEASDAMKLPSSEQAMAEYGASAGVPLDGPDRDAASSLSSQHELVQAEADVNATASTSAAVALSIIPSAVAAVTQPIPLSLPTPNACQCLPSVSSSLAASESASLPAATPIPAPFSALIAAPVPSPAAGSFLYSAFGSNLDVLCLLLSFVGVWDLLGSCSRVCRRWFHASLDPRCFRQIETLRVTQLMRVDATSGGLGSAQHDGGAIVTTVGWTQSDWLPARELPPLPQRIIESFARMLTKLASLRKLEFGPATPDEALEALGEGEVMLTSVNSATSSTTPASTATSSYLPNLRVLAMPSCTKLTDAGIHKLLLHCHGHGRAQQTNAISADAESSMSVSHASSSSSSSESSLLSPSVCFLDHIEELDLSGCRGVTDRGLAELLLHTHSLRRLDVSYCAGIGVRTFQQLARCCPSLTYLSVSACRSFNDECLRAIGGGLHKLRELHMDDCWNVTATGVLHLANGCKHLRMINCSGTYNAVNESALQALVDRCSTSIKELNFTGCPLTDAALRVLMRGRDTGTGDGVDGDIQAGGLTRLRRLQISILGRMGPSAAELTDTGITHIAHSAAASTLRTLDISGCQTLTDASIQLLALHCPNLLHFNISRCSALTDATMQHLSEGVCRTHLQSIDASHVYQLTDQSIISLQSLPHLTQLNLAKCLRMTDACWMLAKPVKRTLKQDDKVMNETCHMQQLIRSRRGSESGTNASNGKTGAASTAVMPSTCFCSSITSLDLTGCHMSDHGLLWLSENWKRAQKQQQHRRQQSSRSIQMLEVTDMNRSLAQADRAQQQTSPTSDNLTSPSSSSLASPHTSSPLTTCFSGLMSLILNDCSSISDAGLIPILHFLPLLESISVVGCFNLTNRLLNTLAQQNVHLRRVIVHGCVEMNDAGVMALSSSLPGLYELGLDELPHLSDASILSIAQHCPDLRILSIARATHVTFTSLYTLLRRCTHLGSLNCSLASQLTALQTSHAEPRWQSILRMVARRGVHFLR